MDQNIALKFYNINVREIEGVFILYNFDSVAGPRLYHGDDEKDPKQRWPFRNNPNWMAHTSEDGARKASDLLQSYLVARETAKTKKKKP